MPGVTLLTGRLEGEEDGFVSAAVVDDAVALTVHRANGEIFTLRTSPGGLPQIDELSEIALPDCALVDRPALARIGADAPPPAAEDESSASGSSPAVAQDGETTASVLDVLVVYTDDARAAAGGRSAVEAQLLAAIVAANAALANSAIDVSLRLVHMVEVAHNESDNAVTEINAIQGMSDGTLDQVHGLRDAYGADLVVLLTDIEAALATASMASPKAEQVNKIASVPICMA
jgi:hypothetical protein